MPPFFRSWQCKAHTSTRCFTMAWSMVETPLEDVDAGHFQTFLEVIHHEPVLTDDTIKKVLQLSKKYRAKNITRQCEEYLVSRSRFSNKKKLQLVAPEVETCPKCAVRYHPTCTHFQATIQRTTS
ncbi:unnamed protein product [Caenorhabditis brenneri]